jgi:SNF2 family DNA or RNA helicase
LPFQHLPPSSPPPFYAAAGYSDYELHCFSTAHANALARWVLPPEALGDSGKLVALGKLLEECRAGGHRPLIFSQWTSVLDIMEPWLRQQGYTYTRLDGSTPVRRQGVGCRASGQVVEPS